MSRLCASFTLDEKEIEWLDKTSKKLQCSRSVLVSMCIDSAKDDLKMLAMVGIKPEHLPLMRDAVKRMKESFRQDVKAMELAES